MAHRREVRRSETLLEHARERFPPGGDPEGRASFELFEQRPLRAVEDRLALDFEGCPEAEPGLPVRIVATAHVPFFPAMTFYAVLITDDTVEILGFTIDEEYFDLIADDPTE